MHFIHNIIMFMRPCKCNAIVSSVYLRKNMQCNAAPYLLLCPECFLFSKTQKNNNNDNLYSYRANFQSNGYCTVDL